MYNYIKYTIYCIWHQMSVSFIVLLQVLVQVLDLALVAVVVIAEVIPLLDRVIVIVFAPLKTTAVMTSNSSARVSSNKHPM